LALGIAPVGAWVAMTARLDWPPILLGLGVLCWTAGFDLIYACQDYDFDASQPGLHSLPKSIGVSRALWLARALHVVAWLLFAAMFIVPPLGAAWMVGLAAAAALLLAQHRLVRADDLSRVNAAFFTANGMLALALFVAALVDLLRA